MVRFEKVRESGTSLRNPSLSSKASALFVALEERKLIPEGNCQVLCPDILCRMNELFLLFQSMDTAKTCVRTIETNYIIWNNLMHYHLKSQIDYKARREMMKSHLYTLQVWAQ